MAADPTLLKALMREKIYSVLTTPALNEYVMLEVLAAGRWRKHLDRLNAKLLAARHTCARQLSAAGITLDHPGEGGLFLWASVPGEVDLNLLVQDAYRNKILLVRGATFSAGLADFPQRATGNELTQAADEALLEAKRQGRNRIVLAADKPSK